MYDCIHVKATFSHQGKPFPAEKQRQHRAPDRQFDQPVCVIELDVDLVGFKAPVVGKRQAL